MFWIKQKERTTTTPTDLLVQSSPPTFIVAKYHVQLIPQSNQKGSSKLKF